MENNKALHEIIPLPENECFTSFSRSKAHFDFPLHYHEEYELNLIRDAPGALRIVGDHRDEIDRWELVLIGPGLSHGWFDHRCVSRQIREITVQFHSDFLDQDLLTRNQLRSVKGLFERCRRGVLFSAPTARALASRLEQLDHRQGFPAVLALMIILDELSLAPHARTLSRAKGREVRHAVALDAAARALEYLRQNFRRPVTLRELAEVCRMEEEAFGRFFKRSTGYSFKEVLNEVRMASVTRMLVETTLSVNEVAFRSGFHNLSHFNRLFKSQRQCTPTEYRESLAGARVIG